MCYSSFVLPFFFLPPSSPLVPAASLFLSHPLLASICLLDTCFPALLFLSFFLFFYSLLAGSPSRDSEALLSYIVTRQYHDGVPGGNLSDLTALFFFQYRGGRCLPSRTKQRYISFFKMGTKLGPRGISNQGWAQEPPWPRKMLIFWQDEVRLQRRQVSALAGAAARYFRNLRRLSRRGPRLCQLPLSCT